jgi:hypothetical protein
MIMTPLDNWSVRLKDQKFSAPLHVQEKALRYYCALKI